VAFLVAAACSILDVRPAQALPLYARQTGQQCAACHNGFPELTPYGRLFKLNGYTFTGGPEKSFPEATVNVPPISMMNIPSFTHTTQGQPGGAAPGFDPNNNWAYTGSLFYGGKIVDHVGAFVQGTYDQVSNSLNWDNTDIRYANIGQLSDKELVYGLSLNNNPTVEDVWNSTPAWGYPYVASAMAPTPVATTLIEGGLAQQVLGFNPYIYWNRLIYAEVGGYRTLSPGQLSALGIPPPGTSSIDGIAPSWRFAVEPAWGNNTWEFGAFGLAASLVPQRMSGAGTDHVTDFGFDTQYEFLGARDSFSLQARYITEYQNLPASQALGPSTNAHNDLHSLLIKGTYYYKQTIGFTVDYFNIQGSSDPLLYGADSILADRRGTNHGPAVPDELLLAGQRRHLHQRAGLLRSRGGSCGACGVHSRADGSEPFFAAQAGALGSPRSTPLPTSSGSVPRSCAASSAITCCSGSSSTPSRWRSLPRRRAARRSCIIPRSRSSMRTIRNCRAASRMRFCHLISCRHNRSSSAMSSR
jgi:hypothetical protein